MNVEAQEPSAIKVVLKTLAVLAAIVVLSIAIFNLIWCFGLGLFGMTLDFLHDNFHDPRVAPTITVAAPFDQVGWASGDATQRHAMAMQMTDSGELIGQSRAELIHKLGEPANVGDDWGTERDQWIEWRLGKRKSPVAMLGDYDDFLRVVLDKEQKCKSAFGWDYD